MNRNLDPPTELKSWLRSAFGSHYTLCKAAHFHVHVCPIASPGDRHKDFDGRGNCRRLLGPKVVNNFCGVIPYADLELIERQLHVMGDLNLHAGLVGARPPATKPHEDGKPPWHWLRHPIYTMLTVTS
jgi:hypothetical protein